MSSQRKQIESQIIAGWVLGKNLKDMDRIQDADFQELAHVAAAIRKCGSEPYKVSQEAGIPITDLMTMTGEYTDYYYQRAVGEIMDYKARSYLANITSDVPISEIKETLGKFEEAEIITLPEAAKDFCTNYFAALDRRATEKIVNTGIRDLDYLLCGIRKKELTAIGARPSVGKSAFALQVAMEIARQGKKVLYFPLEMSTEATVERMFLRYINTPRSRLRRGDVDWAELNLQSEKVHQLEKSGNFLIFESVNDYNVIAALVRKHKPYAIVVDQLEQMRCSGERFQDKRARFSHMTNHLKRLSMVEDVAVLLCCQVNRNGTGKPKLDNLKESGSIEEDSDNVILLHRIPEDDMMSDGWDSDRRPMLLDLAKQRDGSTGEVNSIFIASKFTFYGVGD